MTARLLFALFLIVPIGAQAAETVLIVFDGSHSMRYFLYKKRKIDIAKDGVKKALKSIPKDSKVGLRLFAHKKGLFPCLTTARVVDFGVDNREEIAKRIDAQEPKGTETPLAFALKQARTDLKKVAGKKRILLISDGNETCDGDPVKIAESLGQEGISLDIVGIGPQRKMQQYADMAAANGGRYRQGRNADKFNDAMNDFSTPAAGNEELIEEIPVEDGELFAPKVDLLIVFDSSGSMANRIGDQTKLQHAQNAVETALKKLDFGQVQVGFRAYGHRIDAKDEVNSCKDTELLVPFGHQTKSQISKAVKKLAPKGKTPIALSLQEAGNDLKDRQGIQHFVLLLSDGHETCGGNPIGVLSDLKKKGIEVTVHTVGFDVNQKAEIQLKGIAEATGGTYYPAGTLEDLQESLDAITLIAEKTAHELPVAPWTDVTGGESKENAVLLTPGRYIRKSHLGKGKFAWFKIELKEGQTLRFTAELPDIAKEKKTTPIVLTPFDSDGNEIPNRRAIAPWETKKPATETVSGKAICLRLGNEELATPAGAKIHIGVISKKKERTP